MGKKKLPIPQKPPEAAPEVIIKEWLSPLNPYLWNSRPDPEDVAWWDEHFKPETEL